jgi:hypothetical protein
MALFSLVSVQSWGAVMHLYPSVAEEVLSETVPTALSPFPFEVEDYEVKWIGPPIPNVEPSLAHATLQWVRVQDILVIPRARLVLDMTEVDAGQVSNTGFIEVARVENRHGQAEIPIPLISGDRNITTVIVKRGQDILKGQLQVKFKPRANLDSGQGRSYVDPSCSPYRLKVESTGRSADDWVYVGCRLARVYSSEHLTASLEVFVYWDNVEQSIQVGGIETPSSSVSLWSLRLKPDLEKIELQAKDHVIHFSYETEKKLHNGYVGAGIGPYDYHFQGNGVNSQSLQLLVNLTASYFITESIRIVAVGSSTLNDQNFTDLGLYLKVENYRVLDRRLGVNLLLGAHAVGYRASGRFYYLTSMFPQGIEGVFYDAFAPNQNLTLGAFLFPIINGGNGYYNIWLRWGNQTYVEVNYYLWQATTNEIPFYNQTFGVSVGFPLFGVL